MAKSTKNSKCYSLKTSIDIKRRMQHIYNRQEAESITDAHADSMIKTLTALKRVHDDIQLEDAGVQRREYRLILE